jgi:hypothetical protein
MPGKASQFPSGKSDQPARDKAGGRLRICGTPEIRNDPYVDLRSGNLVIGFLPISGRRAFREPLQTVRILPLRA